MMNSTSKNLCQIFNYNLLLMIKFKGACKLEAQLPLNQQLVNLLQLKPRRKQLLLKRLKK
jgi:hypothetical protein